MEVISLPQAIATMSGQFSRLVLGRGDLICRMGSVASREQWFEIRPESWLKDPADLPTGLWQNVGGIRVESLAACVPTINHDAETFLLGGYGAAF